MSFSPDGRLLLSANRTGPGPALWDVDSGRKLADLGGVPPIPSVWSAAFSPDGKRVLLGQTDGVVEAWDVAGPGPSKQWRAFGPNHHVHAIRFDREGRFAVMTALELTPTPSLFSVAMATLRRARWAGGQLSTQPPSELVVWDVRAGRPVARFPNLNWAVVSPDGRFLATLSEFGPSTVTVWKLPQSPQARGPMKP